MSEEIEPLDADFLQLTQVTPNTTLTVTEPFADELNPYISLLAISNKYGFFLIGSQDGFIYCTIKDCIQKLNSEDAKQASVKNVELENKTEISVDGTVQQIALSEDQLTAFIVLSNNKVLLFNISQLEKEKENVKSFKEYSYDNVVKSILPNPKDSNSFAILLDNDELKVENFKDNSSKVLTTECTAMAWSLDGEFIFAGNSQGRIEKLSMNKEKTQTLESPETENKKVVSIYCQSDDVVTALYYESEEEMVSSCIFSGVKSNNIKSEMGEDPCYGVYDTDQVFNVNTLSQISKAYPNIVCFGCTTSPDIGVIGEADGKWQNWTLPDSNQVSVPLSDDDSDCYPYGMAIDYTSEIRLPGSTPDEPAKEPVPILWIFDSFGRLLGFHCVIAGETEKSSLMTTPVAIPPYSENASASVPKTTFGSALASGKPAFGASGFSFGSSLKEDKPQSAGFGFGSSSKEDKPQSAGFGFGSTKTDEKPKFSFSNNQTETKTEEKPPSTGFSFTTPKIEDKPASSGFSFLNSQTATKTEDKPASSGFSFLNSQAATKTEDKPASSGFSFLNSQTATKTEDKPASSGFGFSTPKTENKPTSSGFSFSTPKAESKPASSGFGFSTPKTEDKPASSGFGFSTPKTEDKPKTSGFGFGTTKTDEKPKPSFSFLNASSAQNKDDKTSNNVFGNVKPTPSPSQKISFSFNKPNDNSKEETKTTGIFGSNQTTPASQTTKLSGFSFNKNAQEKKPEAPKPEVKKTPVPKPSTTKGATKAEVKVKPPSSTNYNHRFIESFNNNYLLFSNEIEKFKEKINSTIENINNLEVKTCPELSGTELAECSLNNSDTISNEIKELQEKVDNINKQTIDVNEYRLNILTELVKVEAKKTEIFKLLNSIKNNTYKKVNMELGLGPEIEEAQNNIRTKVFKIENDIKDISEIIINIRKKMNKKADLIMEVPDLDKIYRSILYITQHTIKISNSLRNYEMVIRKYNNESLLREKPLLFNIPKQDFKEEPSYQLAYDNLLKDDSKDEVKDTEKEQKASQKIQFKKLLRLALTSGRSTLFNDNVKDIGTISIDTVEEDDDEEEEEEEFETENDENEPTQDEYYSHEDEYDSNDDEFEQYLQDDEQNEEDYDEDEDGDIIDDENEEEEEEDVPPSNLSLFSKKVPEKPNFGLNVESKKFNIKPFGSTTTSNSTTSKAPSTGGFNYAAAGMKVQTDPEGTWTCDVCLVKNKPDATECVACETEKPGSKKKDEAKPTFGSNKLGISFGKPSSSGFSFGSSNTSTTTPSTKAPSTGGFNYAAAGMKVQSDPEGTWTCDACMVKNKPDATQCIACETEKPGAKKKDEAKPTFGGNKLGISFGKPSSTGFSFGSSNTSTTTPSTIAPSTGGFNYAAAGMKVQSDPEGTWTCDACMVKNKPDATQCIACETEKPGSKKKDEAKPTFGGNKLGISFGKPSSTGFSFGTSTTSTTTPSTKAPSTGGFNYAAAGMKVQSDPEGTWTCDACMVKNKPDATQCIACETEKPGAKKKDEAKPTFGGNKLGISFGGSSSSSFDVSKFPSFDSNKKADDGSSSPSKVPATSGFSFGSSTSSTVTPSSIGFSFGTSSTSTAIPSTKAPSTEDPSTKASSTEASSTKASSSETPSTEAPSTGGFDYAAAGMKVQTDPEGTWTCDACMVKNKPDATQCVACETEKPGAKKKDEAKPTFGGNKLGITFGKPSEEKKVEENKTSTESLEKPSVSFSFGSSLTSQNNEKKDDTTKKEENIEIEDENKDDELDIDSATEKIGSLGGSTFGSNTTTKTETHNVFGVSMTKPATTTSTTTTAFGLPTTTSSTSTSTFGLSTTPSTTTSAFGQNSTPAFGQTTAFGQSTSSGAFGGFNNTTTASTTLSTFANTTTTSAFGTSSTPAFGQSSFGQTSTPAFGQSSFGQTLAFGQTSAFGKPTAFGAQSSSNNVFGQTTSMGDSVKSSGFGAFSNQNQTSSDKPVFGSSTQIGFGATYTPGMNSAFGTTSSFGNNATGFGNINTNSGFGAFANNSNTTTFSTFASTASNNSGESIFGNGGSFDTSKSQFGFGNSGGTKSNAFTQYR